MSNDESALRRTLLIATLIIAGEMVFALPFHTARFFRPTFLEVFGLTNTELGDMFAAYGVVAMLAYFPGGVFADRFPARWLLVASLLSTAAGGIVLATIPDPATLVWLYAGWGFTTIFLFWGALIRATRDWGGTKAQGRAFGLLEGGRGLVAAGVAAALVLVFATALPDDPSTITAGERRAALREVILLYSAITALSGVLVWRFVPLPHCRETTNVRSLRGMRVVLGRPVVWAQAAVIACAYCAYKGLDNYALYAVEVLGMDEVSAAGFATWGAYLRPVAAIAAGLAADRFTATRTSTVLFAVLAASALLLGASAPAQQGTVIVIGNLLVTFAVVFGLRAAYFALLEENRTPERYTGAVVGMVSFIGFTPEIFFAPVAGRILDANPGLVGHQHYFLFIAVIALAGVVFAVALARLQRRRAALWPVVLGSERI